MNVCAIYHGAPGAPVFGIIFFLFPELRAGLGYRQRRVRRPRGGRACDRVASAGGLRTVCFVLLA